MVLKSNIRSSASPRPAPQHDPSIFLTPLNYIWQLCLAKFSVLSTFFRGRDGTDGTDKQTDIRTDRLFSGNIILNAKNNWFFTFTFMNLEFHNYNYLSIGSGFSDFSFLASNWSNQPVFIEFDWNSFLSSNIIKYSTIVLENKNNLLNN